MVSLISYYLLWHYSEALSNIWAHIKNFLWFLYNFFSIGLLFQTLFAPWQRLEEHYIGGLHPGDLASVIVVNILMRLVGFAIRIFVIGFGLVALLLALFAAVLGVIIWLLMPAILIVLLASGFRLLFS